MKKILLVIVTVLLAFVANAQVEKVGQYYEFKLGDYVFKMENSYGVDEIICKKFVKVKTCLTPADNTDENYVLGRFLMENKASIEEKYGVVISDIKYNAFECSIWISRPEDIKAIKERYAEKERISQRVKEERMNSLTTIL